MVLTNEERQKLDQLFGPAYPAGGLGINPHERSLHPVSRQKLDAESAAALKVYLDQVSTLLLINLFPVIFHLLWIVDENGDLWFSVEEVTGDGGQTIGIFPKSTQARPLNYVKLGHPSLLDGYDKLARIGGEIEFDPDDPGGSGHKFCVTNESGRYGMRETDTPEHLAAVAGKFAEYGLYFWHDFH